MHLAYSIACRVALLTLESWQAHNVAYRYPVCAAVRAVMGIASVESLSGFAKTPPPSAHLYQRAATAI